VNRVRLLSLLLLLPCLLTQPGVARAESGLDAVRRTFLRGRNVKRLLAELEVLRPAPAADVLALARLAAGQAIAPAALQQDDLALTRVAAAFRASDLPAARAAVAAAPRAAPTAWAGALVHLRRGDDAGAVGSLLAPPLFRWEIDAFPLALLAAALPPDDRAMLAAGGGVALARAAARGRVAALRSTALGLAALGPQAGLDALVVAVRALRRAGEVEEARALLALAHSIGIGRGDAQLILERALTAWAADKAEELPALLAMVETPEWALRIFKALRQAGRRGRRVDTGSGLTHRKAEDPQALLIARLASVLGPATRAPAVEQWAQSTQLDLKHASTAARFLESQGLHVLWLAGESAAADALLAAGLPSLLYRLERDGDGYREVPALLRGLDRRTGLWLLDQPDTARLDVVPRTVVAKARLLCVVPTSRVALFDPFRSGVGAKRGARIAAALEAAARAPDDAGQIAASAHKLKRASTDTAVENLYVANLLRRAALASRDDKYVREAQPFIARSQAASPLLAFEVYLQAEGLLAAGDRKQALLKLAHVERLEGESAPLALARFAIFDVLHDAAGARAALQEAIRLAPLDSVLLTYRAGLRARSGDDSGARIDLRRALDRQPDGLLIAVALSRMEIEGGRPALALEILQDTERRDPTLKDNANLSAARLAAERALISGAETVEELSRARRSRSPEARRLLAYALSERVSEPEAAETLLRGLLTDEDPAVRRTTLRLYMRPWLRERVGADSVLGRRIAHIMAKDPDAGVRAAAAALLGRVGTALCGSSLAECLAGAQRDPSIRVRGAAARALSTREDATAYKALVAALDDSAASVRRAAIDGLFRIAATTHGFEPEDPLEKRAAAVKRWLDWLAEQKK